MMCYQMKSETDQLNLRPNVELIKNLEKLAEKFRGDIKKKNEVAVDILEHYMSHWAQAEQVKKNLIKRQLEGIIKNADGQPAKTPVEDRGILDDEKQVKSKAKNL